MTAKTNVHKVNTTNFKEHVINPQPIESMKKSYREENKHWFNN